MKKVVAAVLLGALALSVQAGPTKEQCGVAGLFVATTNMDAHLAGLKALDYPADDREKALAEFDAKKMEAIKAAGAVPAYQAALKDYVVAANDYLRNIGAAYGESRIVYQARAAALKSRLEQAQERVRLEEELACGA